jgi:hypothetical protein
MISYLKKLKIPSFILYWENYGGFKAIFSSPYFLFSLLLTLVVVIFGESDKWYEYTLNILPDILGFSIGSFAILISLGNNEFRKKLSLVGTKQTSPTPFMIINSSFVHFIFIQILAILTALISKLLNIENFIIFFLGILLLIYAIMSTLAATLVILKFSFWYQEFLNQEEK